MKRSELLSESRLAGLGPSSLAAGLWALGVLVLRITGQRFNLDYLGYGWQIVPVEILRDDPLGSVWNLHIQPPLWNLVLGAILRWSPVSDAVSLFTLQLGLGSVAVFSLTRILGRFLPVSVAVVIGVLSWLNPELLRRVFQPTYEVAVACLLTVGLLLWVRLVESPSTRRYAEVLGAASLLVMTRSLYHPALLVGLAAFGGWRFRSALDPRRVALVLMVPVALVGGWHLKNGLMFGEANTSSWVGMNLQRSVLPILPVGAKERLLREGKIGDVSAVGPFGDYDLYAPEVACTPNHDHPSLTTERRVDFQGNSVPNFNFECYLPLYEEAFEDAVTMSSEYPGSWLDGRLWSVRATYSIGLREQPDEPVAMRMLDRVFRVVRIDVPGVLSTIGWGTPLFGSIAIPTSFTVSTIAAQLGSLLGAAWLVVRRRSESQESGPTPMLAAVAGAALITVYTVVVGAIGELGEQGRFRSTTDALAFAAAAIVVAEVARSVKTRRARPALNDNSPS